jgi:hypothetical protein
MSLAGWKSLMDEWQRIQNTPAPSWARYQHPVVQTNGALTDQEVVETPQDVSADGDPWVNRGTHFKRDMLEAIRRYAFEQRIESRQVLDRALRLFFGGQDNA